MRPAHETHDPVETLVRFRAYTASALVATLTLLPVAAVVHWGGPAPLPGWTEPIAWAALVVVAATGIRLALLRLRTDDVADGLTDAPDLPPPWVVGGSAGAVVSGGIMLVGGGHTPLWGIGPALMVAVAGSFVDGLTRRWLLGVATVAATLLAAGNAWRLTEADPLLAGVQTTGVFLGVAAITLTSVWTWDVATRLDHARRVAADLAVADERLRFASDLHDIQGHHLQVIALRSELAARLATTDPERAAEHMRDVQRLSTDALRDTRAVVQGYRRTSLDTEITNAAGVLAAADIDCRMDLDLGAAELSVTCRHLLGLVVREATTNVLRHSCARRADVGLRVSDGYVRLTFSNDGASDGLGDAGGLTRLAERLEAASGTLRWRSRGRQFELLATLPVDVASEVRA